MQYICASEGNCRKIVAARMLHHSNIQPGQMPFDGKKSDRNLAYLLVPSWWMVLAVGSRGEKPSVVNKPFSRCATFCPFDCMIRKSIFFNSC